MEKHSCTYCGRSYALAGNLLRHIAKLHPGEEGATKNGGAPETDKVAAFAFGYLQAWLEGHATSAGIPPSVLTARVAKLLLATARGKMVGPHH